MTKPTNLLLSVYGLLALFGCKPAGVEKLKTPNVIYVFPDQMRNHAMGFWSSTGYKEKVNFQGDPVQTPHIDAFAQQSLVFTSAMSNFPVSSPHRGSLLTGMYPNKSGVSLNCNSNRPVSSLREDATCISDVFSQAGYNCAYFGKLHTDFPTPNDPENPGCYVEDTSPVWDAYTPAERRHGFDYWYSYGTHDVHKSPHYWDNNGKRHEPDEWSPIHEAKEVVAYLKNERHQRDADKPFFIMLAMNPPHSPYRSTADCMEEDYNLYKNKTAEQLLVRPNADIAMEKAVCAPYYFASVTGVDRAFGMVLDALRELHLDKNTIVIFSSDHGETMCSHSLTDPKNSPYAESMNVPFIVRYPNRVKPGTDDLLLSTPDIMPTLLGLAGLSEQIPAEVQGNDYSDILLGAGNRQNRPQEALYFRNKDGEKDENGLVHTYFPIARGIKTAQYTLSIDIDEQTLQPKKILLFNDIDDPYQMNNLIPEEHPEVFESLCLQMGRKLKEIEDPWYTGKLLDEWMKYDEH